MTRNPRFPEPNPKTPPKDRAPSSTYDRPEQQIRPPAPDLNAAAWAKKRHEDAALQASVDEATETITRLSVGGLAKGLELIRMSQTTDGRAAPLWCDTCQTDDCDCETRTALVVPHDGTGEAAITPDAARHDETELGRLLTRASRNIEAAARIIGRHNARAATALEMRRVELDNDPGCESCSRLDRWEPPRGNPSTCKGNLETPMDLCSWCYRWVLDTGRLPTKKELEAHHEGRHVFRPEHPKGKAS